LGAVGFFGQFQAGAVGGDDGWVEGGLAAAGGEEQDAAGGDNGVCGAEHGGLGGLG
jgi:hypothetical protein